MGGRQSSWDRSIEIQEWDIGMIHEETKESAKIGPRAFQNNWKPANKKSRNEQSIIENNIKDSQNENSNKSNYLNENFEQGLQPQSEIVVEINEEM